ncbi:hypothetical protein KY348_06260 [Candidatus Woesearchaeota archaeon]|nr:hypothetical protein [Candidatus Woesearchaeota archaeon]
MRKNYTAEEMGEILGVPGDRIQNYGARGMIACGREAGANMYFLSTIYDILSQEVNRIDNRGKILRENGNIVVKKPSLETLLRAVEKTRPRELKVHVSKPDNIGGGFYGVMKAYIKPTEKVEIRYEDGYNIDEKHEVQEIKQNFVDEFEELKREDKTIDTQIRFV